MKDRRTREEILAEHETLKAAHVALSDVAAKFDTQVKATEALLVAAHERATEWQNRYYKLLEQDKERSVLLHEHGREIEDLARQHTQQLHQFAEQAGRYAAMRGAVIALAGKAKADEIDGFTA